MPKANVMMGTAVSVSAEIVRTYSACSDSSSGGAKRVTTRSMRYTAQPTPRLLAMRSEETSRSRLSGSMTTAVKSASSVERSRSSASTVVGSEPIRAVSTTPAAPGAGAPASFASALPMMIRHATHAVRSEGAGGDERAAAAAGCRRSTRSCARSPAPRAPGTSSGRPPGRRAAAGTPSPAHRGDCREEQQARDEAAARKAEGNAKGQRRASRSRLKIAGMVRASHGAALDGCFAASPKFSGSERDLDTLRGVDSSSCSISSRSRCAGFRTALKRSMASGHMARGGASVFAGVSRGSASLAVGDACGTLRVSTTFYAEVAGLRLRECREVADERDRPGPPLCISIKQGDRYFQKLPRPCRHSGEAGACCRRLAGPCSSSFSSRVAAAERRRSLVGVPFSQPPPRCSSSSAASASHRHPAARRGRPAARRGRGQGRGRGPDRRRDRPRRGRRPSNGQSL